MQLMNEKDRELIKDMMKYSICILGVSEMKWKNSGARDIEDHLTLTLKDSGVHEQRQGKSGRSCGPFRGSGKVCEELEVRK